MGTITRKFKLIQKVKDDNFAIEAIDQYDLCMDVGKDGFRLSIIDTANSHCMWLEDYRFSSLFFTEQLLDQLQQIFEDHHVLRAGFWKSVRVAVRNQPFTLVPGPLFKKENAGQYLNLLKDDALAEPMKVCYYQHPNSQAVSVFSVERRLVDWFEEAYPSINVEFIHQSSAFIEGIFQNGSFSNVKSLYVYVEGPYLTVVVTREKTLEFCNTFFYATPQDFVYYIMFVMDELKLNPDTCKMELYGALTHDSAIFELLYKYVRHVSFGTKPKSLRFSYLFDEVMDHQYFCAYNIYLCE